jgi:ribosomal protein S18 acetylase RimI-like enzyme
VPEPPEINVDRLGAAEVGAGAALLARSFVDEPLFAYLFAGKERSRVERATVPWFRCFIRTFMADGEIHAARLGGRLVGVGVRTPPGAVPLKGVRKARFIASVVLANLRMVATSRAARGMMTVGPKLEKLEPHEPFYGLSWVGVEPGLQGRGIGRALADHAVRRADETRASAWLITFGPETRALYERRGFVVEQEVRPLSDGPVGWTMLRKPPPTATNTD